MSTNSTSSKPLLVILVTSVQQFGTIGFWLYYNCYTHYSYVISFFTDNKQNIAKKPFIVELKNAPQQCSKIRYDYGKMFYLYNFTIYYVSWIFFITRQYMKKYNNKKGYITYFQLFL